MTVEELAGHRHMVPGENSTQYEKEHTDYVNVVSNSARAYVTLYDDAAIKSSYSGSDKPHNNMEPYKVVYIFTRSA